MVLAGGTVVTLVTKAKKCIRKVSRKLLGQQWSVTLTNQSCLVMRMITMMMMTIIKMMMMILDNKAAAGDNLSVHYTGRLDGPEGKIFDTSRWESLR